MSSPFDWNKQPSSLVNDPEFNGKNLRKSIRAQAAMVIDKTLPLAQRFSPLNIKQVTPYLRNLGSQGLVKPKYYKRKTVDAKPEHERPDYPQVDL